MSRSESNSTSGYPITMLFIGIVVGLIIGSLIWSSGQAASAGTIVSKTHSTKTSLAKGQLGNGTQSEAWTITVKDDNNDTGVFTVSEQTWDKYPMGSYYKKGSN